MSASRNPDTYTWLILPGRRVAHAILPNRDGTCSSCCGHSDTYARDQLKNGAYSLRCEQCLITIVSGVCNMHYKFFVDYVPQEVRNKRRRAWREYLKQVRDESKPVL